VSSDVIVVGAINADFVVAAPKLPGPGETVVGARLERHGGGKGANAAVAAARAGARVRLIGAVGDDDDGARALRELEAAGVDISGVAIVENETTGVALIVVSADGENQIAVGAGANSAVSVNYVRHALAQMLPTAGCVLVSTEVPGAAVVAAVECARAADILCLVNPAPVIPELQGLLRHGPVLTPNAPESAELERLLDWRPGDMTLNGRERAARLLCEHTGAAVVMTLGGQGALVVRPGGIARHVPARVSRVRDTTGAGDTFNGVLATRLARGDDVEQAVVCATTAACLSVAHLGARDGMPLEEAITDALAL